MNYVKLAVWARNAAPFVAFVVFVATWLLLDYCCGHA